MMLLQNDKHILLPVKVSEHQGSSKILRVLLLTSIKGM